MGEKVRFGIAGCGVIGKLHAQQLKLVPDAEISGFADEVGSKAENYAAEFGGKAYDSYEEMLKDERVQVVSICTPSGIHGEMAIQAARYGKHVVVEKPIDVSLAVADRMVAACRESGVLLSCIFQHRFDEATVRVKRQLEAGAFGKVVLVNGHVHWYRSDSYYASGDWRGTWALDGGGVLMNQAIHTLDLVRYFGGAISSIRANAGNLLHPRIEVEDVLTAAIQFESGALGVFSATTCAYPGLSTRVEVIGEKGSCIIENNKLVYEHFQQGDGVGTHGLDYSQSNLVSKSAETESTGVEHRVYGNAHYYQFMDIVDAVQRRREPFVTGEEGRDSLQAVLAVYESAASGETVALS